MTGKSSATSIRWLEHNWHLTLPSSFGLPVNHISYATNICKTGRRLNYRLHHIANSTRKLVFSSMLFSIFTVNQHFVFSIFTLKPFGFSAHFQISRLPFRPSIDPLTNAKSSSYSRSSGHHNLIFLMLTKNLILRYGVILSIPRNHHWKTHWL